MPPCKSRYTPKPKEKVQKETVGVYLRLRPSLSSKISLVTENDYQVKTLPLDENVQPKYYSFTGVFDNATQDEVFKKVALPVIKDVITSAKDGLIFSYGVTGSGKTYTMQGSDSEPGLIQRSIYYLFESIRERLRKEGSVIRQQEDNTYAIKNPLYPDLSCPALSCTTPSWQKWLNSQKIVTAPDAQYCLFMSLIELHNKEVNDLFEEDKQEKKGEKIKRSKKLHYDSKTDKTFVVNAREIEVRSADQAVKEYIRGVSRRSVGPTALNDKSSRGHCVLFLKLIHIGRTYDGKPSLTSSQLCLVDLAGSERTKESGVTGGAREETGSINNSLSALRRCFVALHNRQPIINYREHSLTRLFKSYFEGKGKVRMVLCINPATNLNENLHVLEFGRYIQDVATDYATPLKQVPSSKINMMMQEYLHPDHNSNLSDKEYIRNWIDTLKKNRDMKRRFIKTAEEFQARVRQEIEYSIKDTQTMKNLHYKEPLLASSPMEISNPSTPELISESTSSPSDQTVFNQSPVKHHFLAQSNGLPPSNIRRVTSQPCCDKRTLNHVPEGTVDTKTSLQFSRKKGKSVKDLRSSDIIGKDFSHYNLVSQTSNADGDIETNVVKSRILPTKSKGANVVIIGIETMKEISPPSSKRIRASSDASYTQ